MELYSVKAETAFIKYLITKIYPDGIISIVCDSFDFWQVITYSTLKLKDQILQRDGKVVIRPDSGDPVKIITGDLEAPEGSAEHKGAIECLWDVFGGTVTEKGYKLLDSHIGLIYGDSITLERAQTILERLEKKGFCSTNVVFGVGSYTYQYCTRDSFGFAVKATSGIVNGERRDIFKNPKTDNGTKRSAKGLLRVERKGDTLILYDQQTEAQEKQGLLQVVYQNGLLVKTTSLSEIRSKLVV